MNYSGLPQFEKYDLENGWLLDLKEGDSFEFTVDAALTYAHPLRQRTLGTNIKNAFIRDLPPYQTTPTWARILIVFPKSGAQSGSKGQCGPLLARMGESTVAASSISLLKRQELPQRVSGANSRLFPIPEVREIDNLELLRPAGRRLLVTCPIIDMLLLVLT